MNLGGALTWSIETDDFRGLCYGTPFILTKTIVSAMNGPVATSPIPAATTTETTNNITNPSTTTSIPSISTTSTKKTTTSIIVTTPQSQQNPCVTAGFASNPADCGSFYQCVGNGQGGFTAYFFKCATGTVFSSNLITCAYPNMVAGCENYNSG